MKLHEYIRTCDSCGRPAWCINVTVPPLDYEIAGLYTYPTSPPRTGDMPRMLTFVLCPECVPVPHTVTADSDTLLATV